MGNPILQMLGMGNQHSTTNLIQTMLTAQSPQQMLAMMLTQHPEAQGVIQQLGTNPTPQSMQNLCEQLCRQRGLDFNQVCAQAQQIARNRKF